MHTRFIVGPILVAVVIGIILADHLLLAGVRPLVPLLIAFLAAGGWWELSRMMGIAPGGPRGDRAFFVLGLVGIGYFHACAWLDRVGGGAGPGYESLALWGMLGTVFAGFVLVVFRREFVRHYTSVLETVLAVLLLGALFAYHTRIYLVDRDDALFLTLIYFAGIKGTDSAAYLVGSTIGRRRFLSVSPKKTIEGCLGGVAWGMAWFGTVAALGGAGLFPWSVGIAYGIILAVAAQVGDLSESLIKRTYETKDSGALLPEFGGVLDLVDSLLFTGCVFWYMVR